MVSVSAFWTFFDAFSFVQKSGRRTTEAVDELRPFTIETGDVTRGANATLHGIQKLPENKSGSKKRWLTVSYKV